LLWLFYRHCGKMFLCITNLPIILKKRYCGNGLTSKRNGASEYWKIQLTLKSRKIIVSDFGASLKNWKIEFFAW
jgi:hypothetical protein